MKNILLFLLVAVSLYANANPPLQFKHFTIKNGLSNNSVRRIIQDNKGMLWFGTLNGLNRFDGTNFRVFKSGLNSNTSLTNNRIHYLQEDAYGYLWIGTFDNKIYRFDPDTETFLNVDQLVSRASRNYTITDNTIVESSPGVIWIMVENGGLIRFVEHQHTKAYKIDRVNASNVLPGNEVTFVHKDNNGNLWIGTTSGLVTFPSDTFRLDDQYNEYYASGSVAGFTAICETDKAIWFGTQNSGVLKYDMHKRKMEQWREGRRLDAPITTIEQGVNNDMLIATRGQGVMHVSRAGKKVAHYHTGGDKSSGIQEDSFNFIYPDDHGIYWLVSDRRGVTAFEAQKGKFTYFGLNAQYREPLGDDEKHVFYEDSNGDLWLGLYGGGLCRFDRENHTFDQYFYNKDNPASLSSNLVLSIFEDHSKNLWIGTFQGGLNKLSLHSNNFEYTQPDTKAKFRFENEVRSVYEDHSGRLWAGTKEGKIYCYNKQNDCVFTIPDDLRNAENYDKGSVYSLLGDRHKNLWIGTKGEGLYRIVGILNDQKPGENRYKIEQYKSNQAHKGSISANSVYALYEDQYGQIWVGTYNGGLNVITDPAHHITFKHYQHDPLNEYSISDNRIRYLMQDSKNNLWIGTSNGLNMITSRQLKGEEIMFRHFKRDPQNPASLSNNDVIYLHQDKKDNIWAGTYGGGLNKISATTGQDQYRFEHYSVKQGLSGDIIFSIQEDNNGSFWLGTDNGLCKFNPADQHIENYLAQDGIGDNTFSEGACLKSQSGELIFGHLNGFVRFYPEKIQKHDKSYPIVFTGFDIFSQRFAQGDAKHQLSKNIEANKTIFLKHNQNFIEIDFAVLDYKAPEKIQYSFILEHFEDNWNYVVGESKAIYRGLAPGEYVFKVKGTNSDGFWVDEPKQLKISIAPPFWKTNWAYLIYFVMGAGLVAGAFYVATRQIKMQNEINLEKRLSENKIKFYTNISHEFKTPLTLITGPVEDLISDPELPASLKSKVQIVKRNSNRLLNLIEQLLHFRKIQSGKMEIKTRFVELYNYFNDIYLSFLPLAEKKCIHFVYNPGFRRLRGWIDPKHMEKIIMNLLSNAFKHTPSGKQVVLEPGVDEHKKLLIIKVMDEGSGIGAEHINRIFDRFTFIDRQDAGTGIGLSLTRDLIQLHKGVIEVESKPNVGSTFTISIPIGPENYTEEEKLDNQLVNHVPDISPMHIEVDSIVIDDDMESPKSTTSAIKNKLLIIEDNEDLRKYLCDKFEKYSVVTAAPDGAKGLDMANEIIPDLIICDIMMPGISGLEVTNRLKSNINTSHIPVILLTARSTTDQKIEGIETGADDYITKPFNFKLLKIRVDKIIEQRKKLKEKFGSDPNLEVSALGGTSADQQFMTKVIALIEEHMSAPDFNVASLVAELGFSRTLFYKKLKSISGLAPNEFVRAIKMKKAVQLLESGHYTVAETSYEIGISDPNYFSKCFKQHFGESPREYCKNRRLNPEN